MLALALAALDAAWLHKLHIHTNREYTLQAVGEVLLHIEHTTDVVAEEVTAYLHLYLQCVEVAGTIYDEHILWLKLLHLKDDALHLRWEYIDTTNDEHIVAATHNATHLYRCTTAGTLARVQCAEILGAVAEQRHTLLGKGGEDQLALLAVGELLQCVGVDNLGVEVVLVDV